MDTTRTNRSCDKCYHKEPCCNSRKDSPCPFYVDTENVIILPFKEGDVAYVVRDGEVEEEEVYSIEKVFYWLMNGDIGYDVFTTYEEALKNANN